MNSYCLPFTEIPHSTRLFLDLLSYAPKVRPFYPNFPRFNDWVNRQPSLKYDSARRLRVADALERQNQAWGASPLTLKNIDRLRTGANALVTGQQVGLFGGPLFAIFKALTAIKLASQATEAGNNCVPVFWLATEDHDLEEINHVSIPGRDGSLQRTQVPSHGLKDAPVGSIQLNEEIEGAVQSTIEGLNLDSADLIRDLLGGCYRAGENFGTAYARLFTRLFAEWGVILLDAADTELHVIAEPIYRAAIEGSAVLNDGLLERGKQLEAAGYHQQVKVTPASTLLFKLQDGARTPIHRQVNGGPEEFTVRGESFSKAELVRRIESAPQDFSPNVLLRPVVQDYLLPTLAYAGGSAETAYFAQAAVVYQEILGEVTPVVPRFSATLLEAKVENLLERYRISLPDVMAGAESLGSTLADRTLPRDLQQSFNRTREALTENFALIRQRLADLDATLVDSASHAEAKMSHQLESLHARAARAELRHSEVLERHAQLMTNAIYPNQTLQEREIAGIYFIARYGGELLRHLYGLIQVDCFDHQVVSLQSASPS